MYNYHNLLTQSSFIIKQYDKIAELTGENFNIFNILGLTTNEVRMHSALLGELLNPKGSHGQKEVFLKLFCEQFYIKEFNCEKAHLSTEKYIGKILDDYSDGGFLDIILHDSYNNSAIIIENKILARDQHKQLERYYNYASTAYKSFHLFYLTLDGRAPEISSIGNLTEDNYVRISYCNDIIKWLEKCRQKAVNQPLLRETITQYIISLKNLTGQTMNEKMNEDLVKMITSTNENMLAAIEISKTMYQVKRNLLLKFAEMVKSNVLEMNPSIIVEFAKDLGSLYQGINFKLPDVIPYIQLSFLSDMAQFYIEVVHKNDKTKNQEDVKYYKERLNPKELRNWGKIENVERAWHGDWVCRYHKLDNHFNSPSIWSDIASNNCNELATLVAEDLSIVIRVLKEKYLYG